MLWQNWKKYKCGFIVLFFPSHVLSIEASVAYLQLGAYYQSPI